MGTKKLQSRVHGLTDGLNLEASALNILPSEMMDGTVNVELLQNGAVRRRKGVDFLGTSAAGGNLQTVRTASTLLELKQESPSAVHVELTAPNGDIVKRIVLDVNNTFLVFKVTQDALTNIDAPTQTISRSESGINHSHDSQKFSNMQFAQSGNRMFFAGKHIHSGYLKVAADNENLEVVYLNAIIRDPAATTENATVKNNDKWYECIVTHTSDGSSEPGVSEGWEQFWFVQDGALPTGIAAWGSGNVYTSTFIIRYDKTSSATSTDTYPTTIEFFAGRVWLAGDPKYPNEVLASQVVVDDGDLEKFHQFADPFDASDATLVDDDGLRIAVQGAGLVRRLLRIGTSIFLGTTTGIWQISGGSDVFKATSFKSFNALKDGIDGPESMVVVDSEFVVFGQNTIWRSTIQSSLSVTTQGQASFKSISENRVETRYTAIPAGNKASARALYNPSERRIYYFYNKTRTDFDKSFNNDSQPGYSKDVLILDTRFQDDILATRQDDPDLNRSVKGSFFEYGLFDGAMAGKPYIACPFVSPDVPPIDETVVSGVRTVTNAGGATVVASGDPDAKDVILFLAMHRVVSGANTVIKHAFGTFNTSNLRDWSSNSTYSTSYNSPLFVGIQSMGDLLHRKNITYIYVVFKRVESGVLDGNGLDLSPGGCFMATAWNFANTSTHPKHSKFYKQITNSAGVDIVDNSTSNELIYSIDPKRQVYNPTRYTYSIAGSGDDGDSHVYYKHRVRGRGNAVQVMFTNEGDKDYHLIGWTQQFHGKVD